MEKFFNMKFVVRLSIIFSAMFSFVSESKNLSLWWDQTDSMKTNNPHPGVEARGLSNEKKVTMVSFFLYPGDSPIEVKKVEYEKRDTTYLPLEPLHRTYSNKGKDGQDIYWTIDIDFPFTYYFDEKDYIVLHTDKGVLRAPLSKTGQLLELIGEMKTSQTQLKEQLEEYRSAADADNRRETVMWSVTVLLALLLIWLLIFFLKKFRRNRKQIEDLSALMDELISKNTNTTNLLNKLYNERRRDFNLICDEYYEKKNMENMKLSMYNEIEKHILTYKDSRSLADLENNVNLFQNDILKRLKEQLPELTKKDFVFLTYLFGGFSARAICTFTDINLKQFYYRRNKLREMISESEAPDREEFVSKI